MRLSLSLERESYSSRESLTDDYRNNPRVRVCVHVRDDAGGSQDPTLLRASFGFAV